MMKNLRRTVFATVSLVAACSSPSPAGVVDGQEVVLDVGTAELFAVNGLPAGRVLLSHKSLCTISVGARTELDIETPAVGTYSVSSANPASPDSPDGGRSVEAKLDFFEGDGGIVELQASSGTVIVEIMTTNEVSGWYDIGFGPHGHVKGSFDAPRRVDP